MCAFMPKYHWFPFFEDVISGSRRCSWFFVEGDAAINVGIHNGAAAQQLALRREMLGNGRENRLRQVVTLEQMTEIEDCRLVEGMASQPSSRLRTCASTECHRVLLRRQGQTGYKIAASNRCAAWSIVGTALAARLAARPSDSGRSDQRFKCAPRHHSRHLGQEYVPFRPLLLCRKVERAQSSAGPSAAPQNQRRQCAMIRELFKIRFLRSLNAATPASFSLNARCRRR